MNKPVYWWDVETDPDRVVVKSDFGKSHTSGEVIMHWPGHSEETKKLAMKLVDEMTAFVGESGDVDK